MKSQWDGASGKNAKKETDVASDKTVLLDEQSIPLIFGWLIDLQTDKVWRIDRDAFHIGGGKAADLQLPSRAIKDLHCSIYWIQDHFEVNDHNTQTGTKVNDHEVKRQDLADDDVLAIAEFAFQFKCFKGMKYG